MHFKCILDRFEEIPVSISEETGVAFPGAHEKSREICVLAKALRKYHKDSICRVPFCLTVEAEALGANIKLGDEKIGPRVGEYAFKSLEELKKIKAINLTKGRISEVLNAVESLSKQGETVALSVQGPFTIMSSLIDPLIIYKAVRKDRAAVEAFMEVICSSIEEYIQEALKMGVKIISFGDSAGSLDILGPKTYKDYSGRYSHAVLKRIEDKLGKAYVHLCGVTSTSMDKAGFIKSTPIEVEGNMTYGEALEKLINTRDDVKIIGHNCLKKTNLKMSKNIVWKIDLK